MELNSTVVMGILMILISFLGMTQIAILFSISKALSKRYTDGKNDEDLKQVKEKTDAILTTAVNDAHKIVAEAETQGLSMLTKDKAAADQTIAEFTKQLMTIEAALKAQFDKVAMDAGKTYTEFITSMGKSIEEHMKKNDALVTQKADMMVTESTKHMQTFAHELETKIGAQIQEQMKSTTDLQTKIRAQFENEVMTQLKTVGDVQSKVKAQLDAQMQAVQKEVEAYKLHRMKLVDEHMVDMMEEVLVATLGKKLTLKEHGELTAGSLEQAKKDGALGN